ELRIPTEASWLGRIFLATSIMPAAAIALATTFARRAQAWSSLIYVAAIATVVTAQMIQRAIQLPKGYDVVPFLMPLAVLLSLGVVQIPFRLLAPSLVAILTGVVATESVAFPLTPYAILMLGAAVLMALVVLRFAYRLEQAARDDWLRAQRLYLLARRDTLTGLPNRRAFDDDLVQTGAGGLLLLDLDHLKACNDRYGHAAGDDYLVAVGQALAAASGPADTVYRVGGDEFAALLAGDDEATLTARAEALLAGVRTARSTTPDVGPRTSVSAGFALLAPSSGAGRDADELWRNADRALYQAKSQGRDRLVSSGLRNPTSTDRSATQTH
ncbi:MAG: GGDEF domain-containing protein, partial [Gordonia sp. (in: high G+C Gram-positive bacteria)]|uniref:GGDEF domain-containing protein n=1 Tax=Gordonia sp. (in: high G+C Gram-positive bacteria) TaxID=84139 RepID=UPI003BB65BAF